MTGPEDGRYDPFWTPRTPRSKTGMVLLLAWLLGPLALVSAFAAYLMFFR